MNSVFILPSHRKHAVKGSVRVPEGFRTTADPGVSPDSTEAESGKVDEFLGRRLCIGAGRVAGGVEGHLLIRN